MSLDCLSGLVGLSDRDCPCFEDGRPATYNDSDTGYYLTDPEYGFPLKEAVFAGQDCSGGSVWDMLDKARDRATRDFQTDLTAALYENRASAFSVFAGLMGKDTSSMARTLSGTYQGILIKPKPVKGGTLTIRRIGLDIDATTSVTLKIYSTEDLTSPLHSVLVSTTANTLTYTTLVAPIELPLYNDNVSELRYYIVYESPAFSPNNNKFTCCSKRPGWMAYLDAKGYNADDLTGKTGDGFTNGIILDAHLACSQTAWLCEMDEVEGYDVKRVVGRAIQMKAAVKVISEILRSGNINLYTMSNREAMYIDMKRLQKQYENQVVWLTENVPTSVSDCFKCDKNIQRRSILV